MAKYLGSGQLNNKLSIEKLVTSYNSYGEPKEEWQTVASCVHAQVLGRGGAEQTLADQRTAIITYEVTLRYREGVLPSMRFKWGSKTLNIDAAYDPDGRRRWLVCLCKEVVA